MADFLVLLYVALSMFAKDGLGTLLVVAEAKGRSRLAGDLDALGDLATTICTIYGAGQIAVHGWHLFSIAILAVMMITSRFGTKFWTDMSKRIHNEAVTPYHHAGQITPGKTLRGQGDDQRRSFHWPSKTLFLKRRFIESD